VGTLGNSDSRFVIGANLPWVGYGTDFGASAWYPSGGLSAQPAARVRLDDAFLTLAGDGISLARVFLLCDGRSGLRFDRDGLPIGLDDIVFADMDVLLGSARRNRIQLMLVLLDFHLCSRARIVNGVQLGGRGHLVATDEGRLALADEIVRPIVRQYGHDETIAAWDIMNEPEWCVRRLRRWSTRISDRVDALQECLADLVACVRQEARQPITIGSAGTWQLDLVISLGLDFYQVHWYEKFGWAALERPVTDLHLDRPVILGEFSGTHARVAGVLGAARRAGYAGALVWSMLAEDAESAYPPDVAEWVRANGGRRDGRA
jgi:hypothetical protein